MFSMQLLGMQCHLKGKTKLETRNQCVFKTFSITALTSATKYHIYSNTRRDFFLKFGTWTCEVILNLCMKRHMRSLWTGRCGAKPRPASPNHSTEWQFVTDILEQPISPSSRAMKSRTENRAQLNLTDTISCFCSFVHCLIFQRSTMFQKPSLFPFSGKEAPNLMDHLDWVILTD